MMPHCLCPLPANTGMYPSLDDKQKVKLRQLTIVTLAEDLRVRQLLEKGPLVSSCGFLDGDVFPSGRSSHTAT